MELVDGPSLACLLLNGALGPARSMDVIAQTAAGLDAAHKAGLVHRDIKPANLLLDRHGHVKITDFGVADAVGCVPVTGAAIVGTPAYLAPERLAGTPAAPVSDLYSLGIVAYECLTGHPPFTGTSKAVATAHRDSPLPPLPDTVPPEVAELVAKLTAKDPEARPESAGQVASRAARLRDGLSGGAATAPFTGAMATSPTLTQIPLPDPPADHPRRWPARDRSQPASMLLALAAAAVLLAGIFGVLAGRMLTTARAVPRSSTAAASALKLDVASLAGEPVGVVRSHLRQLGLVVRVVWEQTRLEPARTVVRVEPADPLHAGNVVTVTAALPTRQLGSPDGGQGGGGSNDGGSGSHDGGGSSGDSGSGSGDGGH
jgi:serine/threonine-protein kinase